MSETDIVRPDGLLRTQPTVCPLCGSTESRRLFSGGDNLCGIPGEFHVDRCLACRHRYMNPRPVDEDLAACYPAFYGPHQEKSLPPEHTSAAELSAPRPWYLRYLPLRHIPGLKSLYHGLMKDLSQIIPAPHSASRRTSPHQPAALEIGCASGRYLHDLKRAGWNVFGVEPGTAAVNRARAADLEVHHGTLDTCDRGPETCDLAAAWMVLEHVPDPRSTLTQMAQLLRPGGQLLISVPNAGCWEPAFFGRDWYAWDLPRHLQHFSPKTIRRLVGECGFEDVQVIHQRTVLNVIGSLGIRLKRWRFSARIGQRLLDYPESPKLWLQLLLAPPAHVLAWIHQGGRLTITARKPEAGDPQSPTEAGIVK